MLSLFHDKKLKADSNVSRDNQTKSILVFAVRKILFFYFKVVLGILNPGPINLWAPWDFSSSFLALLMMTQTKKLGDYCSHRVVAFVVQVQDFLDFIVLLLLCFVTALCLIYSETRSWFFQLQDSLGTLMIHTVVWCIP